MTALVRALEIPVESAIRLRGPQAEIAAVSDGLETVVTTPHRVPTPLDGRSLDGHVLLRQQLGSVEGAHFVPSLLSSGAEYAFGRTNHVEGRTRYFRSREKALDHALERSMSWRAEGGTPTMWGVARASRSGRKAWAAGSLLDANKQLASWVLDRPALALVREGHGRSPLEAVVQGSHIVEFPKIDPARYGDSLRGVAIIERPLATT